MHSTKLCYICLTVWMVSPLAAAAAPQIAEPWPQRTVRIVVPISVGTGVDIAARLFWHDWPSGGSSLWSSKIGRGRTDSLGRLHSPPRVMITRFST